MKRDKKIYTKSIAFLSLVYLNFFFFAPYIHFHSEEENVIEGSSVFHSHLSAQPGTEHEGIYSSDDHSHSHQFNISNFSVVVPARNLILSAELKFPQLILDFMKAEVTKTPCNVFEENFFITSLEKYVHSASNISPPLIA
jgi:hypothetical protein